MPDIKKYIPEGTSWLRAAVSSIPVAGSALDHLLFDKADAIRMRNMETAVAALSLRLEQLGQQAIDQDWFSSEEALAAFKILSDKASYEPDKSKIDALGSIVASCGSLEHKNDPKKLSVLEHLSRFSAVQIRLLGIMLQTPPKLRKFSTGDLEQTVTAIWLNDVMENLRKVPIFWNGELVVNQELEILESFNAIRRIHIFGSGELGYTFTVLGRHAATYLNSAGL
jgi:hypothetical protein